MAKREILAGATDQTIDVFIQDSSSTTGGGLTGLVYNTASLTCYYRKGATGTPAALSLATQTVGGAHSDGGFVAVDGTNCPGQYRLDLSDTIVASAGMVTLYLKGAANMAPCVIEIEVVSVNKFDAVRMGMTALPNAAADAAGGLVVSDAGGFDIDNRAPAAAAVTNMNTVFNTDFAANYNTTVDAWNVNTTHAAGTAWNSGAIGASTLASDTITAAKIAADAIGASELAADAVAEIQSGLSTLTQTQVTGGAYALNSASFAFNSALDFTTTQKAATLARVTLVDTTTTNTDLVSAASIADAVWEEAIADHSGTSGSTAEALAAAGSAGDPWSTALPGSYTAGQAGYIIGTNLDDTISSRASQASVDTVDGIVDSILVDTAEIGAAGAGLTALAQASIWTSTIAGRIDVATSTRMATYTQPTGFLAATFPTTVASTTNITAASGIAVSSIGNNVITAASIATDAGTEFATAVWASGTRTLTAGTNIDGSTFTAIPWNASWDAEVQSEVDDALIAKGLDHLVFASVTGTDIADNSIIARLVSKSATADWDTYTQTTDSLEALRDQGDAAWITATGFSTHSASDVWAVGTRILTAGTNIVLAKGTGVTGFNDLSAAQVNAEADTALADYDGPTNAEMVARTIVSADYATSTALATAQTSIDDLPTNAELATALGTADDATLAAIAALNNVSTAQVQTAAAAALTAYDPPTQTELLAAHSTTDGLVNSVKAKTDNLPSDPADQSALEAAILAAWTTALTESYAADGSPPTPAQALFLIMQRLTEFAISGTTVTVKKLDGSTTAATLTLDSDSAPTSSTRAT